MEAPEDLNAARPPAAGPWPLSHAQRAVWLDLCMRADPLSYQLSGRVLIDAALVPAAAHAATRLLMARHDALRLRVETQRPLQHLAPLGEAPVRVHDKLFSQAEQAAWEDATHLPAPDQSRLDAWVDQVLSEVLPLGDGPLFHLDLMPVSDRRWELVWRCNHLIVDAISAWLMVRHWGEAYNAVLAGTPEAVGFGSSFVGSLSQDETYAASPRAASDRAYWRERFDEVPPPVFDRQATPSQRYVPACWVVEGEAYTAWRAACAHVGVTEQQALLALLALAVGTRHDRNDFTVGMALHRRTRATREVFGMLAGVLPVRCRWQATDTLAQAVAGMASQLERDYRRQRLPVDEIGREVGLAATGHGRLFDVSLSYMPDDGLASQVRVGEGRMTVQRVVPRAIVPVPVMVVDRPHLQRLEFELGHDPAYVSDVQAKALAECLQRVISAFSAELQQAVSALQPVSAYERAQLLAFNPAPSAFPLDATLHALVRAQARATPEAVALIDGARQFSYADLDAQSDLLARQLGWALAQQADAQVQAEPVVAVALPRSAETVIALLAILKAGAVYLPLDTSYPPARLQYLLDDAQAALMIDALGDAPAQEALRALRATRFSGLRLPPAGSLPPALHDDAWAASSDLPPSERLAYVIYTSGSTGEPKPVGVSHRAAVNLSYARQTFHDPIGPGDRILAAISVGFDVSIGQLLLPLLQGAAIVIAPSLRGLQPADFWALLARHRVTQINSVPSFFETVSEALMALPEAERYTGLKRLMLGGEALSGPLALKLRQRLPGTQLVNMYGPTETCIDATAYVVPEGELPAALPIGRPLPNYRAYVLDSQGRLAALGVTGELCVAGAGVARGYLRQAELTAGKFADDPFADPRWPAADRRLYRTGDLARWRVDAQGVAQIEFLGRNDQQVKIRGHRIETGEIDAVALEHPAVRQSAVVARPDGRGQLHLVAYLVADTDASPDARALQAWLAQRLPEHMVPAAVVWLPALPLTPNGKLDRKALPAPSAEAVAPRTHVPPQGPLETLIADVWQTLLDVPQVGRDDNFFDLGGHSLLALSMIERLRQAGWRVDVPSLFADPTPQALALACRALGEPTATAPAPAIPAGASRITPEMLPLVALTPAQIDTVVRHVPGGAAAVQDIYPLAPLQQGMLYHHLMQDEGDTFLSPFVLGFPSRERLDAFVAALREVVARHDILRTSLVWADLPEPVQVVWREATLPLEERPQAEGDALAALKAHVDPRHHRIDLTRAPLMRAVAQPDAARGRWLLALLLHHLALDHTSMEIVLQEVAALQAGHGAALPAPVPFRTQVWLSRRAAAQADSEAFFREHLADVDSPTTPFGLATLPHQDDVLHDAVRPLPPALSLQARETARRAGVSIASFMHLAWALVLARCSGRDDVVFGTVLLGRLGGAGDADQARALGMMINTLPLRVRLGSATVGGALRATHAGLSQLMRHEHAPLALAQRCSGVAAPTPLFTALFNFRHTLTGQATSTLGLDVVWVQERTGYPLALAVDDDGSALTLDVQALAPAQPEHVARLLEQAVTALVAAADEAEQLPCDHLDLLPPAERDQLLHGFNPAPTPFDLRALHTLVHEQALRTPSAAAVIDGETMLSYAELDALSDTWAQRLRAALGPWQGDTSPEPVVGVALPRSADTVVVLLAILKAGAVYLPLDTTYPLQRLQYMLDDAHAVLLVDTADTAALVATRLPAAPVSLPARIALPGDTDPERLAYVIYTSGSTGQPKAVGVSHRAAVNLAHARQRHHDPIGPGDRILAAISVGFDVSIGQLLLPLLAGATVVIAPPLRDLPPDAFWSLLARHRVSHINSVPSFFDTVSEALMAQPEASRYRGLKRLMLGGEALTGALARKLQQRLPGTQIVNMYGPTEACIDATAYGVPPEGELPAALPIGQPLPNYRAYVLDAQDRLVPLGVSGELCLAGAGLARGYLGRPDATAEKFVADPYGALGERMYRTGDLARWRLTPQGLGEIEFLGRNDEQVKVRGMRVETGEIEAALLAQPGLRQAAVLAPKDSRGLARLVAYLVADPALARPSDDTLRARLAQQLPEHMVPQALVWIDGALPITPNGKLDRKALPAPTFGAHSERAKEPVPPRTPLEARLLAVWTRVFERPDLGVLDDFFELGGHSLLAMRLIAACQAEFRQAPDDAVVTAAVQRLNLRHLLTAPTVAALAQALEQDGNAVPRMQLPLVPLRAEGSRTPVFCIHPQGGTVMCFTEFARQLPAGVPVLGLQAPGLEPGDTLLDEVEALARHYLVAIRQLQPHGPYQLVGYSAGGLIAHAMAQQLHQEDAEVALLAVIDSPLLDAEPGRQAGPAAEPTDAELLAEAWSLLSPQAEPASAPRHVADAVAQMRAAGWVDASYSQADADRMLRTSRALHRAIHAYRVDPLAQTLHLVRALQRSDALPDWAARVQGGARLHTLDLPARHHQLLQAPWAQQIATWLTPLLRG